jgi:hypothetical protein
MSRQDEIRMDPERRELLHEECKRARERALWRAAELEHVLIEVLKLPDDSARLAAADAVLRKDWVKEWDERHYPVQPPPKPLDAGKSADPGYLTGRERKLTEGRDLAIRQLDTACLYLRTIERGGWNPDPEVSLERGRQIARDALETIRSMNPERPDK